MPTDITDFHQAEYKFLSNFYPSPIVFGENVWPTVEHAYQAYKTLDLDDRERILKAKTPGAAKKLGRKLKTLRPDWDEVKESVMRLMVEEKFTQHPELASRLMETGNAILVEGNDWGDRYWGMERENGKWVGENRLGRILMELRGDLQVALSK